MATAPDYPQIPTYCSLSVFDEVMMSWVAQDGGIELGDARRTRRLIKFGGRFINPTDRQYSLGERRLGGDQGGLPVAGYGSIGLAGAAGGPHRTHVRAVAGSAGGVVPSGHHGVGFHLATGDGRFRSAQLCGATRVVRASDLGGHARGCGAGGDRCLDVGAPTQRPTRCQGKYPLGGRLHDRGRLGRTDTGDPFCPHGGSGR